jgi:hypothetical protein
MEKRTFEPSTIFQYVNKVTEAPYLSPDLPSLVEKIKHECLWQRGELNSMVLSMDNDKRVVLTAAHKGTIIDSYQSNSSTSLQVIEGKLKFFTRRDTVILEKGQLLIFSENIKYSLSTSEETVFLLTIVPRNPNLTKFN